MKLAGLFAGIMVKNEFKAEYKHKNKSSGHRVRCWIPSSRETNFEIQFGFLPDNQCNSKFLVAKVHLHGKYIGTFIGDECSLTPVSIISGMQGENGVVPLRFIQQRPADNVRKADDTSELDTIKIIIEQKRWFKHRDATFGPEEQSDFPKTREDTAKALYSEDTGGRAVLRTDRDCSQLSKPGYYLGNAGPKPKEFVFHSASQSWLEKEKVAAVAPSQKRPAQDDAVDITSLGSSKETVDESSKPPPNKKLKTKAEAVKTSDEQPSLSSHLDTFRARRTRLDTHSQQLRAKAGIRSTLESNQAGSEETRNSDHLLALQLSQLINEYQDLIKDLLQAKHSALSTSSNSSQSEADQLKLRSRKLNQRVQDLEDDDASMSEDNRLRLILSLGQLTRASEDLVGEVISSLDGNDGV